MELIYKLFAAAFLGGGCGACLRFALGLLCKSLSLPLVSSTLIANILGCFVAGMAFFFLVSKAELSPVYKILIITGFCGGLSTLSALSLEVVDFIQQGSLFKAFVYVLFTMTICILSAFLGMALVKRFI